MGKKARTNELVQTICVPILQKELFSTLDAMEKTIASNHDKNIDSLKLDCTLTNTAILCLCRFTDAKSCPFTKVYKFLFENIREQVAGGLSIVFTREAVVDKTFLRK